MPEIKKPLEEAASCLPDTRKHRAKGIAWDEVFLLKRKGLSNAQVGKLLGCSAQNIDYLIKKYGDSLETVETYKKNRADLLAAKQSRLLEALTDEKIEKMAGRDLVVSLGILQDKERLQRDQSTMNLSVMSFARLVEEACK